MRDRRRELHWRRSGNGGRNPADQKGAAGRANYFGHFECVVRIAAGRARSGEFSFLVLLHKSRTRPGHRKYGEAGAIRFDSGARARTSRKPAVSASAEAHPGRIFARRTTAECAGGLARTEQRTARGTESVSHRGDCGAFSDGDEERESPRGGFAA